MDDFQPQDPAPLPRASDDLAMRMLYEEQKRLRAELDELRSKQQEQSEKQKSEGGEKGEDEKEEGKKSEGADESGKEKDTDKDKDKDKDEDNDKDKEQEKKPPLKDRVRGWAKQHPVGTILIVVGAIVLIIGGILLWRYLESYENTDDAFVDGHTDPISPRISGFVSAVYVENTYYVKKGQLLISLDPKDYLMAKEQAIAELVQAQAGVRAQTPNLPITSTSQSTLVFNAALSVDSAAASLSAAQEKYRSAIADMHQAEASEENAAREEQRYKLLVDKEEVSREMYDQRATEQKTQEQLVVSRRESADAAAKAVTEAEASLHEAQQQADEAKRNMPRQVEIQNQMLAVRKADELSQKARADQADLNFGYTQIYAPADGIIGDKQAEVGMQVQPGQELCALTELNDVWVTANFKETQIKRMRAGQPVTIHVDSLSQDFDGYIEALPGASGAVYSLLPPENATGNYVKVVQRLPVRIRFRNGQKGAERLAPGMSVEPKVWIH
jgi:membrane fusion protein, multidrug efflux system